MKISGIALLLMLCSACTSSGPELLQGLGKDVARGADLHKCRNLGPVEKMQCEDEMQRRHREMERQIDEYEHEIRNEKENASSEGVH